MAFSEFELKKIEKALATFLIIRRPPPEIRSEVDLCYRLSGQRVMGFWGNDGVRGLELS